MNTESRILFLFLSSLNFPLMGQIDVDNQIFIKIESLYEQRDYQQVLEMAETHGKIFLDNRNWDNHIKALIYKGKALRGTNSFDKASKILKEAVAKAESKLSTNSITKAQSYEALGDLLCNELLNYQQGFEYFQKSLKLFEKGSFEGRCFATGKTPLSGNRRCQYLSPFLLGRFYLDRGQPTDLETGPAHLAKSFSRSGAYGRLDLLTNSQPSFTKTHMTYVE